MHSRRQPPIDLDESTLIGLCTAFSVVAAAALAVRLKSRRIDKAIRIEDYALALSTVALAGVLCSQRFSEIESTPSVLEASC
jgi:hypothetical protein